MAYSRRTTGRKTYRRTAARPAARRGAGTGRTSKRAASGSRRSAAPRTIRIVVETANVNPVQRPALGVVAARAPRKPAFV